MIIVMATMVTKPEKKAALQGFAKELIDTTRKESGCISYELFAALEEDNRVLFVERWESKQALDAHSQTPHFLRFGASCAELLQKVPEVVVYEAEPLQ